MDWGHWSWISDFPVLPIQIILVNSLPGQTWDLGGGNRSCGFYNNTRHAIVVTTSGWYGDYDSASVTIAHEFGHHWGLPHQPPEEISIMNYGAEAFRQWKFHPLDAQRLVNPTLSFFNMDCPCCVL